MNDSETKPAPAFAEDSQRSIAALQSQITMLLLTLVILSGILTAYLYVQQRFAIQDRELNKQLVGQFIQIFRQQQKPAMDGIVEKLREYGRKDLNFVPILNKYGYGLPPGAGSPALPTAPKTATPGPAPVDVPKKK
jgi:hypothetical protein